MKKIIFLSVLLIFLVSCTNLSSQRLDTSSHTGTRGIELKFVQNNPPPKIYKGEPLNIVLEIYNKGAFPQEGNQGNYLDGKVYIHGYDTTLIDYFFPKQLPVDLYGKDEFNTEGGFTSMDFESTSVNLPDGVDSLDSKIMASVCYRYQTIASPTVCIDPDPYSTNVRNKPCSINQVSTTSSQGAPLAVTKVEEDVLSDKIRFKISISNVGGGLVIESSKLGKCPFDLNKYDDVDIVYVSGELSNSNLYCTNNGQLKLRDGKSGTMICDSNKPEGASAYKTPLKITLDYAYTKSIETNLKIVNSKT